MVQGIANSLNLTLARMSSIESNFMALDSIMQTSKKPVSAVDNSDFKAILDEKLAKVEKIDEPKIETISNEIPEEKKEAVNLKSKIDLISQTTNIDELIETFSNKYDINSDFIKAIIKQESNFNPNATSKKGAMGLMQLMPKTAESLGVLDAYNPSQNIEGGVKYLRNLLNQYDNNEELALAAYNAGPGAVKKYGGVPPYKETQNYVNNVMAIYNKTKEAKL